MEYSLSKILTAAIYGVVIHYASECLSRAMGQDKIELSSILAFLMNSLGIWFFQPQINRIREELEVSKF